MKLSQIVHGGGWVKRQSFGRPKTKLFTYLSLGWLGVSIPTTVPLWLGGWPGSFSAVEWFSILLLLPEPVFIALLIKFALTEKAQKITEYLPNPDFDLKKLY